MNKLSIKAEQEDSDFWKHIADVLNLRLYGWTYKNHASFFYGSENRIIQIDKELAEHLVAVIETKGLTK
jgi:hypothetical protein